MAATKLSPVVELADGNKIPLVGLGTFLSKDEKTLIDVVAHAYKVGYRHFDTAILYGNEDILGKAFQALFKQGVKREELFITTKMFPEKEYNPIYQLKESLKRLQLDYVDLYLLHWPWTNPTKDASGQTVFTHQPVHQVWPGFEECRNLGLAKSIGVSNFNVQSLIDLFAYCKIKPVVNQIELSPYLTQPGLIDFCNKFKIHVTAYSPLARGGTDVTFQLGTKIDIFNEPLLVEIGKKHNKSSAQVALAFWVAQNVSVIPKSEKNDRVAQNFDCFDWKLSPDEIKQIASLNKNIRTIDTRQIDAWHNISYFE